MEKLAAVDMGSNAVRLLAAELDKWGVLTIKRRLRVPLRLGSQAFGDKTFSPYTIHRAGRIFSEFRALVERDHVRRCRVVATSAYREAANAELLGEEIRRTSGLEVEGISAIREAELIFRAVQEEINLAGKNFLLADIGGGSLELSCIAKGKLTGSCSFQLGTVRLLALEDDPAAGSAFLNRQKGEMEDFIRQTFGPQDSLRVIGTGGNFRRMLKLKRKIHSNNSAHLTVRELEVIHGLLRRTPFLKRIKKFHLRPDRADVIIPAMQIALMALQGLKVKKILCPDVGLAHGALIEMAGKRFKKLRGIVT